MTESQTNITDSQLLTELKNSYINENQKKELVLLIPTMTAEERVQLMGLIEQSTEGIGKARKEHDENMNKMNKEYNTEVKNIDKEYAKKTTEKLEEIDSGKTTGELKQVESEIATTAKSEKQMSTREKLGKAEKHTLRNVMLVLIILAALVGGILYILSKL